MIYLFTKVFSDSHDANIVEKAKEINKQIKEKHCKHNKYLIKKLEEEPLPLNDPFAGDGSFYCKFINNC